MKQLTIDRIEQAAVQALGCDVKDIRELKYDHYGLKVYSYSGLEYAIGTDEEADKAAAEYIKESFWAFNASFILSHSKTSYSPELEKCLKDMQGKLCEGSNSLVMALIEDMDSFIEDAIGADGRGAFLSSYDSGELELKIGDEYFYAYRLN